MEPNRNASYATLFSISNFEEIFVYARNIFNSMELPVLRYVEMENYIICLVTMATTMMVTVAHQLAKFKKALLVKEELIMKKVTVLMMVL